MPPCSDPESSSVSPPSPSEKVFSARTANVAAAIEDGALVDRFRAGDETAFVEIADRYRPKLFLTAFEFVRNRSDAEEIAQDALVRAHRALANFRGESSLATWLHRVVCNLARNHYWHMKRRGAGRTLSLDSEIAPGATETFAALVTDRSATASHDLSLREFSTYVDASMEKLEPALREILTLRNIHRLSYQEIGERLQVRPGTVKTRIARARRFLARNLNELCPDFGEGASLSVWFEDDRGRNI